MDVGAARVDPHRSGRRAVRERNVRRARPACEVYYAVARDGEVRALSKRDGWTSVPRLELRAALNIERHRPSGGDRQRDDVRLHGAVETEAVQNDRAVLLGDDANLTVRLRSGNLVCGTRLRERENTRGAVVAEVSVRVAHAHAAGNRVRHASDHDCYRRLGSALELPARVEREVPNDGIPRELRIRKRSVGVVVLRAEGVLAVEPSEETVAAARHDGRGRRQRVAELDVVHLVRAPLVVERKFVFDCGVGIGAKEVAGAGKRRAWSEISHAIAAGCAARTARTAVAALFAAPGVSLAAGRHRTLAAIVATALADATRCTFRL